MDQNFDISKIQSYLSGLKFPISKQGLIDYVKGKGAPSVVVSMLNMIPDKSYNNPTEVSQQVSQNAGMGANKGMSENMGRTDDMGSNKGMSENMGTDKSMSDDMSTQDEMSESTDTDKGTSENDGMDGDIPNRAM